jgi:hypothetical protein
MVFDALNGRFWGDDAQIAQLIATKEYGATPGTEMTVRPAVPKGMKCPICEEAGKVVVLTCTVSDGDGRGFIDEFQCPECGTFVERHTTVHPHMFQKVSR